LVLLFFFVPDPYRKLGHARRSYRAAANTCGKTALRGMPPIACVAAASAKAGSFHARYWFS
jgi:hypothetical protein